MVEDSRLLVAIEEVKSLDGRNTEVIDTAFLPIGDPPSEEVLSGRKKEEDIRLGTEQTKLYSFGN